MSQSILDTLYRGSEKNTLFFSDQIISDDSLFWTWMGGISKFDTMLILYEYDFWVKNIKIPPKKDLVISRYLCRYKYGCNLQIHTAAISPILMILHKELEKSKNSEISKCEYGRVVSRITSKVKINTFWRKHFLHSA